MSERFADIIRIHRRPAGKSTLTLRCPFCSCETEARLWGLAGSGKRSECGAVSHRTNATAGVTATRVD